jgi:hypothetical protein
MRLPVIAELGARLEERWRAVNYDERVFPDMACAALADARLPDHLTSDQLIEWALTEMTLPPQKDPEARFGQPPLTLFQSPRFHVDALHWIDGSTTIHQHSFSGAFQVLVGSSIETRYAFDQEQSFDGHFVTGRLRVVATALHAAGDVTPIRSGPTGLIHSLFHLDRPSVSVVVRTYHDDHAGPQFRYARPGIGIDPFFVEPNRDRVLQVIELLRNIAHPSLERWVGDLIARSDLHTAYRLLESCVNLPDRALFDRLAGRVRDTEARDRFAQAFEEKRRISFLYGRRGLVKDPELRFFIGVLLNATCRADVLALVHERAAAGDPARQVAAWLRQLSAVTAKLQAGGSPWQPNLLGLPEFDDDLERTLADVLAGRPEPSSGAPAAKFIAHLRALPSLAILFA